MSKSQALAGLVLAIGLCAGCAENSQSYGHSEQWCPRADTQVRARATSGEYTVLYRGTDRTDDTVCVSTHSGSGTGVTHGGVDRRLYGWYDLDGYTFLGPSLDVMRAGLGSILSGRHAEVSFDIRMARIDNGEVWSGREKWTRLDEGTIVVDRVSVRFLVLRESFEDTRGSSFNSQWDVWYDTNSHVFAKGHHTISPIEGADTDWDVVSVSTAR